MYKFLMGLFAGYLTMTESGKKITEDLMKKGTEYLKQEGVIEQSKTTRPPQSDESSSEFQKQPGVNETVN